MSTTVAAQRPETSAPDVTQESRPAPAIVVVASAPLRSDKAQCMFPTKCKWPTCSC